MGRSQVSWVVALSMVAGLGCATTTVVPGDPHQDPPARGADQPKPGDGQEAPKAGGDAPKAGGDQAKPDPMAEMMKAYAEAAAVGEHHKHLAMLAGEWDVTQRHWMAPKTQPMESTATATAKLILGGRFLLYEFSGTAAGQPFTGMGLMGYDNLENWHTGLWMDSMSTNMMLEHGTCDEGGKLINLMGSYTDPVSGERKTMRSVYRVESDDRYVLEVYMPDKMGNEFKSVELVHVRRKPK